MNKTFLFGLLGLVFSLTVHAEPVPKLSRVLWVWLENVTTPDMSGQDYIKDILKKFPSVRFSGYRPVSGITQANAFAMIAGQDFGIANNDPIRITAPSLVDLLQRGNIPWKVYAEDFPSSCNLTAGIGNYKRYRVPFLSLSSIQSDPYLCMKVLDFEKWFEDSQWGGYADFSILIPNLPNSGATSDAKTADAALKNVLKNLTSNADLMEDTTVIISSINRTKDQQNFLMIFGNKVKNSGVLAQPINHYHLLRTVEEGLSLGTLNQNDASVTPLVGFWK